jgi:hypothetical protein
MTKAKGPIQQAAMLVNIFSVDNGKKFGGSVARASSPSGR